MSNSKKTKVLYVVESFSTGVYAIVRDIACNLDQDRFEVRILHSLRNDSPRNYEDDFKQSNVTLRYLPMGSLKDYFPAVRVVKQEIKDFNPDSIHFHSSKGGFLGRIAAHRSKARLFYTPHGISFIRTDVSSFKRFLFLLLETFIQWYTPVRMIAISQAEYENVLRLTKNATTIKNFIPIDNISPHVDGETTVVGITGRITEAKNPPLFNRIAYALPHISFLWVGDGPLRSQLDAENITITGQVSRDEALQHLTGISIYIQTSDWEGLPISLLEAMAAKIPVIVTRIPAHVNLIDDGETGIICDINNDSQFVEAIQNLISNPDKRTTLGQEGYDYVNKHHNLTYAVQKYAEEYQGIKS